MAGLVVPVSLFQAWITRDDLGGATFSDLINDPTVAQEVGNSSSTFDGAFFFGQLIGLIVTAVGGVAVSRIVGGWFDGRDESAMSAIRFTVRRSPAILGVFVIVHVAEAIGFILLVLPGFAVLVLSSLASPVLALETLGPVASVRRSWELVRRRTGFTLSVILLVGIVQYGVSQAVGTLPSLVAVLLGPDRVWPLIAASNLATSIILVPVTGAAMCLTYLDIRFRTEGLDLERRVAKQFGSGDGP